MAGLIGLHPRKLVFAVCFTIGFLRAELPPGSYETLQANAEEVLLLNVDTVVPRNDTTNSCLIDFTVNATVIRINTTTAGFMEGDFVLFNSYILDDEKEECQGFVGPQLPPSFEPGWCGLAHLNLTEVTGILRPTAYGRSFVQVDSEQCQRATSSLTSTDEDENITVGNTDNNINHDENSDPDDSSASIASPDLAMISFLTTSIAAITASYCGRM
jgi:hypothetical protein